MTKKSSTDAVRVLGTTFRNRILLAAGTAGFGREIAGVIDIEALGGLVTKAVSVEPRKGHAAPRVTEFDGGMLNSVGLANPGVAAVLRDEIPWMERNLRVARVIVNVVGDTVEDYATVISRMAGCDIVTAFELNVSCPNTDRGGEEFGADDDVLAELVALAVRASDKPLVVKLGPNLPDVVRTAQIAAAAGARAISVVNTLPGYMFGHDGAAAAPRLGRGQGGVSGPPLLPIGVWAVKRVSEALDLPVIGVGGVRSAADVSQYLSAGATLVAIGTAALADPRLPERIAGAMSRV